MRMKKKPNDAFRELGYSNVEDSLEDEIANRFEKIKHQRPKLDRKDKLEYPSFNRHMEALKR